ncbi:TAP-like protein-domain-containing protein [Dendryphion nanum]|uniref:TAP-like protein-domain-containing protein n=1 Tax=Dendryphion nanum TaxID=256645 RepID=A0A9P9D3P6_9PLEO|nr:TAP-like protein-domain-containing protein [Dendryphion nanum]
MSVSRTSILFLSFFAVLPSTVFSTPTNNNQTPALDKIKWQNCTDPLLVKQATAPILCGNLTVPLDYTDTRSNKTHTISLVKVPALKQPAKGSIQFNFGGPGYAAKSGLVSQADVYHTHAFSITGGIYDLLAFDPRGVSAELKIKCAPNNYTIGAIMASGGDMSVSDRDERIGWANSGTIGGICKYQGNGNKTAEYIGTVAMARDIKNVAEAVDADGLIRWWGYSYGTTIGSTLAAMFPDKIDRMINDGIQNPHQYYRDWHDSELWTLQDTVVYYFFTSCLAAGSKICPLAGAAQKAGRNAHDLFHLLVNLIEALNKEPLPLFKAGIKLDGMSLKGTIFDATYDTLRWPAIGLGLIPVLLGTPSERLAMLESMMGGDLPGSTAIAPSLGIAEANWGIHCGDRVPRTNNYTAIQASFKQLFNTSYFVGGLNGAPNAVCAQWPWKAKEIYTGNFKAKTRHPILILSNALDGQTPMKSALNVSSGFEGSVILENDGAGHAAFSAPGTCLGKHTLRYWVEGKLPDKGTVCKPDWGAWETKTWRDVFVRAEWNKGIFRRGEVKREMRIRDENLLSPREFVREVRDGEGIWR